MKKALSFSIALMVLYRPGLAQESNQYLPAHAHIKRLSPTGDIIVTMVGSDGLVRSAQFHIDPALGPRSIAPPMKCILGFEVDNGKRWGELRRVGISEIGSPTIQEARYNCPSLENAESVIKTIYGDFITLWKSQDHMPPLSVLSGQGARVNITNENTDPGDGTGRACNVSVSFSNAKGQLLGPPEKRALDPEQIVTVNSPLVSGLTRATVSLDDPYDRNGACAIRSTMEVFELSSKRTNAAISTNVCLGAGNCGLQ